MKNKLLLLICLLTAVANAQQPKLEWVKQMGGNSGEGAHSISVDSLGYIYSTGIFQGTADFDPGPGVFNLTATNGYDMFVSKIDNLGNFIWAKKIGVSIYGTSASIAIDRDGSVYTTAAFGGTNDFDPGSGVFNITSKGGQSIFILKLDASGNFVWVKNLGGGRNSRSFTVIVDASKNVYTTGEFNDTTDFDPDPAKNFNLIAFGASDIFISKLNSSGNFVWAKQMGGKSGEWGKSLVLDRSGNLYAMGVFNGTTDFDPGVEEFNLSAGTNSNIFISKLDGAGNFLWAKNIGGTTQLPGRSIAVDVSNNVYTTGYLYNTADFDPGPGVFNLTSPAFTQSMFISKLNSSGNFVWAKQLGGQGVTYGYPIALDASGYIYASGFFSGILDSDPGPGTYNLKAKGEYDIFISKLNSSGDLIWAVNLGTGKAISIVLDKQGKIYTAGNFEKTTDFDPDSSSSFNLTSKGMADIFIHKMSQKTSDISGKVANNIITVYPNPANDKLNIESIGLNYNKIKIQVINSLGQIVMEEASLIGHSQFNIKDLPKGLYFVKVISDNQIIATQKIVKQ